MPYEYTKSEKTTLRALALDERWLQERVAENPSILGLGDLTLIRRGRYRISKDPFGLVLEIPNGQFWNNSLFQSAQQCLKGKNEIA